MDGKSFINYGFEWIESMQPHYKKKTYDKYYSIIKKEIQPFFYDLEFNENTILNFFDSLSKASSGLNTTITVMESIVLYIELNYDYKFNFPITLFKKYSRTNTPIILDADQISIIRRYCMLNQTGSSVAILLSMYGGLKIGEISALRFDDIKGNCVNIQYQTYRISSYDKEIRTELILDELLKPVKRTVIIPMFVADYIESYKEKKEGGNNFLLTNRDTISDGRYASMVLQEIGAQNGFKVNFNILRETYKHYCINCGMNINVVANLLGVSKIVWSDIEECTLSEIENELNRVFPE